MDPRIDDVLNARVHRLALLGPDADAVKVRETRHLSGYTGSGDFRLKILADNAGVPGASLLTLDLGFTSFGSSGVSGIYQASFSFAPFLFSAGVTYWVGLSGNGFEAAQLALYSPQNGMMAQFNGSSYSHMTTVGDQAFQLIGTPVVPEPGTWLLLGSGLACIAARLRSGSRR